MFDAFKELLGRKKTGEKTGVTLAKSTPVEMLSAVEPITEADRDAAFNQVIQILKENTKYPSLIGNPEDTALVIDKVVAELKKDEGASVIRISADGSGKVSERLLLELKDMADSLGAQYEFVTGGTIQNIGYIAKGIVDKFAELSKRDLNNRSLTILLEYIDRLNDEENDDLVLRARSISNGRADDENMSNVSFVLTSTQDQSDYVRNANKSKYNAGENVIIRRAASPKLV